MSLMTIDVTIAATQPIFAERDRQGLNPFSVSSSGMRQLPAPAVLLTLAPSVQSLSLNARNFRISESVVAKCVCVRVRVCVSV